MDIDIIRYFGAAYIMESNLSPKEKCNLIDYVKEAEWDQILNLVFNGDPPSRKLTINEQYILEAQAENHIYPLIHRYIIIEGNKKDRKGPTRKEKIAAASMKEKAGSGSPTASEVKKTPKTKPKSKPEVKTKTTPKPKKSLKFKAGIEGDISTDVGAAIKKKGGELYQAGKQRVTPHIPTAKRFSKGASVVLIVAAATAAGHRLYKIYLSKAARQCKGLGGPEKRNCLVKIKKAAYQVKMNSYIKARSDCGKSKNPQQCQRSLDTKIKKVRYRIGTLYSRM